MFRTFFSFELMFWLRGFMLYIFLLINTLIVFGAAWSDNIQSVAVCRTLIATPRM